MRRLEESLSRLAERGERGGADVLLDRVEQRLALGGDPVVVALDPRRTDMQTQQETPSPTRRRGLLIAAAAFGVIIAIAISAVLVSQFTGEQESLVAGQPPGPLEEFVEALNAGDVEAVNAVVPPPLGFPHWLIGLDASGIEFTDCRASEGGRVLCAVSMGQDWFYSQIVGYPMQTTFSAVITDKQVRAATWPHPDGLIEAEAEFEAWVLETYPERYNEMFSEPSVVEHIRFGYESGAARTELLDEFLASR